MSLQLDDLASSLSFLEQPLIFLHPLEEVLPALGVLDMLNTDVDALRQDPSTDALVHDDAKGVSRDVVYPPSLTMVHFVWHTFLHSTITLK